MAIVVVVEVESISPNTHELYGCVRNASTSVSSGESGNCKQTACVCVCARAAQVNCNVIRTDRLLTIGTTITYIAAC